MVHARGRPDVPHLRIGEHFVDGENRSAGDTGGIESVDPIVAGASCEESLERGAEGVAENRGAGAACSTPPTSR